MRNTLLLVVFAFAFTIPVISQSSDEFNKNEFYAGYLHKRSDDSVFSNGANGFNAGYTRNFSKYFGVRGEIAGTYKNRSDDTFTIAGPVTFDTKSSFYTFHAGIQIKNNKKSGTLKPFAHALVGLANDRVNFTCTPSANCGFTQSFKVSETGFSAGLGGGLDLRVNDRVDVRLLQVEYNPKWIDSVTVNNVRFGFGIVIK